MLTATWQLSCLPNTPQYWRATPTECLPFFGKLVSSMIQNAPADKSILGTTHWLTRRSISASDHCALATKWCSDWCRALACNGSTRAAIGSTLLRDSGNIRPVQ